MPKIELYDCALWRMQSQGLPKPEKHYACSRGEIAQFFTIAQADDTTVMLEVWESAQGYNPCKNWVWEPENPNWQPSI